MVENCQQSLIWPRVNGLTKKWVYTVVLCQRRQSTWTSLSLRFWKKRKNAEQQNEEHRWTTLTDFRWMASGGILKHTLTGWCSSFPTDWQRAIQRLQISIKPSKYDLFEPAQSLHQNFMAGKRKVSVMTVYPQSLCKCPVRKRWKAWRRTLKNDQSVLLITYFKTTFFCSWVSCNICFFSFEWKEIWWCSCWV